jgi:hypothetical protein
MNNNKFNTSSNSTNLLDIEKLLNDNNVTNNNFNNFIKVKTSLNDDKKERLERFEKADKTFNKIKKGFNTQIDIPTYNNNIESSKINENSLSNESNINTEDKNSINDNNVSDNNHKDIVKNENKSTNFEDIYNLMDTLTNLKLLSHVKQSDKLACNSTEDVVQIDTRYYLQGIRRWYYGDNREETIKFIDRLILSSENLSETLILGLNTDDKHNLKLLTEDLISCKTGLNNLKSTYFDDKLFISKIENYIEKVNMRINKNNKYIV